MGNIAFIASTLPIPILKYKIKDWEIDEIVVSSINLQKPFFYLIKNSNIIISVTPSGKISNFIFILNKLSKAYFNFKKIYFFHECCWFNFDFLIDFIKVKAFFYPQVTLKSFEKLENTRIHSNFQRYTLKFFNCTNKFIQYKVTEDNNEGYYYVLSKRLYKNNVQVHSIFESLEIRNKKKTFQSKEKNNVLFLVGRETVSDNIISSIYELTIEKLSILGFKIYIKDHPRENTRLKINSQYIYKEYDPNLPFELIDDSFLCIIGCASTSLINNSQPAFSIINFIGMNDTLLKLRIKHLIEISGSNCIYFPNNIDELIIKINEIAHRN
jgi:hypothetical protein